MTMAENDAAVQPEPGEPESEQTDPSGQTGQEAGPGQDRDPQVAELEQALAAAEARAEDNWNRCLRAVAELENVRKRTSRDLERARKFGLEPVFNELLPVRDSLEMGLAAADEEPGVEALREGTEATLRQLEQVMEKFNVEAIDPQGEPFDPNMHEAMVTQPSTEAAPNSVIEVVQKGYQLNGRLLRPARVIVARAPD